MCEVSSTKGILRTTEVNCFEKHIIQKIKVGRRLTDVLVSGKLCFALVNSHFRRYLLMLEFSPTSNEMQKGKFKKRIQLIGSSCRILLVVGENSNNNKLL